MWCTMASLQVLDQCPIAQRSTSLGVRIHHAKEVGRCWICWICSAKFTLMVAVVGMVVVVAVDIVVVVVVVASVGMVVVERVADCT